jgi:hypothetical protein
MKNYSNKRKLINVEPKQSDIDKEAKASNDDSKMFEKGPEPSNLHNTVMPEGMTDVEIKKKLKLKENPKKDVKHIRVFV